jgi:hypothetical protein
MFLPIFAKISDKKNSVISLIMVEVQKHTPKNLSKKLHIFVAKIPLFITCIVEMEFFK